MYDIPIIMFHSVNDEPEKNPMGVLSLSSQGLNSYLKLFKKWKYQMISMDDFLNGKYDPKKNFIVLTFDDGFKDNLTVAMPLLKKYGARGTIFVNPCYVSNETDTTSDWGFMTWNELEKAEASGVFDIQAHTMTHEFIFTSDKVIDYYTPEKFKKYYWLAWMLFPDSPRKWDSTSNNYKEMIPVGYPIFEYGRRLASKKFTPNQEYVEYLIKRYAEDKTLDADNFDGERGYLESDEDFKQQAIWQVLECKKELESRFNKKIHTICFPGGGYTNDVLTIAKNGGYKCYMRSGKLKDGNNYNFLAKFNDGEFVGFNRTSFSMIKIPFCSKAFSAYWVAKLSLGTYQNKKLYKIAKSILSKVFSAKRNKVNG